MINANILLNLKTIFKRYFLNEFLVSYGNTLAKFALGHNVAKKLPVIRNFCDLCSLKVSFYALPYNCGCNGNCNLIDRMAFRTKISGIHTIKIGITA